MNQLKADKVLPDYAIIGAVAALVYIEPMLTADLDVVVLVDSDEDYLTVYRRLQGYAEGTDGMHVIFGGVPVQVFPHNMTALYEDAFASAKRYRIGNMPVKVASAEHLVLLALQAFREKDRLRVGQLMRVADVGRIDELLRRFDDAEGTLAKRLASIRSTGL